MRRSRIPILSVVLTMFLAFLSLNATAHADPAAPAGKAAQASSELRFFTYNICGEGQSGCGGPPKDNARRIDTVVSQARDWGADEVFLQEVCRPQYDAILLALKPLGFRGMFTTTVGGAVHCGADYGMAVLVRGPVLETAELDLTAGGENEPIKSPCIKTYTKGRANWACSVHLYWSDGTLEKIEAAKLTAQTDAWRAAGTPVILGGDFNHTPVSVVLDYFYTAPNPDGNGAFVEADETDQNYFTPQCAQASQTHCRSGRPTRLAFDEPTDQKIDYLFLSQGDFTAIQGEVLPRDSAISDHRLYRGTANFTAEPAVSVAPRASVYNPVTKTAEIFAITADGSMVHDSNTDGAGWSGWTVLGAGAKFKGAPVAEFNPSTNALELFALGTDDRVWHAYYQDGWSTWTVMNATTKFKTTPTAVFNPTTNAFEIFALGTDNSVWHNYNENGTGWSGWSVMNDAAKFNGAPTAAYNPTTNALEVFALGTDEAVYQNYNQNGTGWSGWSVMNATAKFKGTPSVVHNPAGNAFELFALGTDNAVYHNYNQNGTGWTGWMVMNAAARFATTPTAVYNPSTAALEIFALGTDNAIYQNYNQNGTPWSDWTAMNATAKFKGAPTAVFNAATSALELFGLGTDNAIYQNYNQNGTGWSGWIQHGTGPYAIL
ncbi:endonuclease/exonuclease/phosphatase family protein [Embleya sp. NBC_00896]|uniref:endonuclease/exonuclease/phosphatase family protein n=1 Tax=Embleya sp. NBC_00896 TaxID=2975961 RepID=UPI00386E1589|nr:endonuclease/exonuclease/phosphatase family protein [Embleya sp. NBC_00896]